MRRRIALDQAKQRLLAGVIPFVAPGTRDPAAEMEPPIWSV